jgi:hypothetical protein
MPLKDDADSFMGLDQVMDLAQLDEDERLALVGLSKLVVRADHELSAEERVILQQMRGEVGAEAWVSAVEQATQRFRTRHDVMLHVQKVQRAPARKAIYLALQKLASEDELIPEEEKILNWLAKTWSLQLSRQEK